MITDRDWMDAIAALDIEHGPDFRMVSRFVVKEDIPDTRDVAVNIMFDRAQAELRGDEYLSEYMKAHQNETDELGDGFNHSLIVRDNGEVALPSNPMLLMIDRLDETLQTILVWSFNAGVSCMELQEDYRDNMRALIIKFIGFPDGLFHSTKPYLFDFLLAAISRGKVVEATDSITMVQKELFAAFCGSRICRSLELINSPCMHIVESFPTQKMNDLRWRFSRSHYYVVSAEHNRRVNRGERISLNGTITRAMHWRRAHFRMLRSERWGASRGKQIWVRRAWVGPTTWIGMDEKTYVVVPASDVAAHRARLIRRLSA